jgi:hypothetical protein
MLLGFDANNKNILPTQPRIAQDLSISNAVTISWKLVTDALLGWDSKSRVFSTGKRDFSQEGDSRVYIKLSGKCVYKDPSCPSSNNLQSKINLLCALNLTKWLSSTRCV